MVDRAFRDQIRTLGEDAVSYAIYVPARPGAVVDGTCALDSYASFETLQVTKALVHSIVERLTKGYIWHQDAFSIRIDSGKRLGPNQGVPCLRGRTRFGDCLDDEWMVVHLLREVTRQIPGAIAQVYDNDGEFLLIEAADCIPNWLNPENSENRVFIYEGNLHIIPPSTPSEEECNMAGVQDRLRAERGTKTVPPKLDAALNFIRRVNMGMDPNSSETSLAASGIQEAAFSLLTRDFADQKIHEQKHYARCRVPLAVAKLLKVRPELVTRACNAFYTRDGLGLAACSRMDKFLPLDGTASGRVLPPAEAQKRRVEQAQMVTTAVCFTKTCFAQLVSQPFQPPKSWNGIVPPPDPQDARDPQKVKESELGMKLTCGFEILCSADYPGDFGHRIGEEIKIEAFPFATDYNWRVFKNTLSFRQYFGDERPGSQEYRRLEEQAKRQFLEAKMERDREDLGHGNNKADQGHEMMEDADVDRHTVSFYGHGYHPVEEIEKLLLQWAGEEAADDDGKVGEYIDDRPDDDDSWMTVSLADLEAMMHAKGLRDPSLAGAQDKSLGGEGLGMEDVLGKFESFVDQGRGGFEGAEFLEEQSDDDTDSDDGSDTEALTRLSEQEKDYRSDKDEDEDEDEDEDIFASDYEERVAERQAKRNKGKQSTATSLFVFDDHVGGEPMEVDSLSSSSQRFTVNAGNIQRILADQFGVTRSTLPARGSVSRQDGSNGVETEEEDQDIRQYMEELDVELARTKIGESFERTVPMTTHARSQGKDKGKAKQTNEQGEEEVVALDEKSRRARVTVDTRTTEETIEESIARSRRGHATRRGGPMDGRMYGYDPMAGDVDDSSDEEHDASEDHQESRRQQGGRQRTQPITRDEDEAGVGQVNVDLNLAKNLLESFKSQGGLPGPGSNLLGRLGIVLPRDEDGSDEYEEVAYDEESDDGDPRY